MRRGSDLCLIEALKQTFQILYVIKPVYYISYNSLCNIFILCGKPLNFTNKPCWFVLLKRETCQFTFLFQTYSFYQFCWSTIKINDSMKSQSQTIFSFCPTAEVESISGFLIEPSNNLIKLYLDSLQNFVK